MVFTVIEHQEDNTIALSDLCYASFSRFYGQAESSAYLNYGKDIDDPVWSSS